jgi:uncharacterized protein YtpQ (UPF0354 family)
MEAIMNHTPHFPPKVLKQMNVCRIFLQVLTLADISDGSGHEILKDPCRAFCTMTGGALMTSLSNFVHQRGHGTPGIVHFRHYFV